MKIKDVAVNSIVEKNGILFKVTRKIKNRVILKPLSRDFLMSVKPFVEFEVKEGF